MCGNLSNFCITIFQFLLYYVFYVLYYCICFSFLQKWSMKYYTILGKILDKDLEKLYSPKGKLITLLILPSSLIYNL